MNLQQSLCLVLSWVNTFLLQKAIETEHVYNILYNTLILVATFCVMLQTQEKIYGWKPWTVSNMCLIDIYQRQISKIPLWRRKRGKVGCFKNQLHRRGSYNFVVIKIFNGNSFKPPCTSQNVCIFHLF